MSGKRTNPNIFRLGKISDWKYKYFEKKSNESSVYAFKNLEIKKFITQFLNVNGLLIHDIKLYYFNNVLHISVSYFLTLKAVFIANSILKTKKIKLSTVKSKIKRKYLKNIFKIKKCVKNYNNGYEKTSFAKNSIREKVFHRLRKLLGKILIEKYKKYKNKCKEEANLSNYRKKKEYNITKKAFARIIIEKSKKFKKVQFLKSYKNKYKKASFTNDRKKKNFNKIIIKHAKNLKEILYSKYWTRYEKVGLKKNRNTQVKAAIKHFNLLKRTQFLKRNTKKNEAFIKTMKTFNTVTKI